MKKKILVVGANSALAQDVMPVLAMHNDIVTAGRKDCDVYCDITKSVSVPADVAVVINFAAHFGGTTDKDILKAQATNVNGALNVCMAAKAAGVSHIIHISSLSAVLAEDSPYYTSYAVTKKHADELIGFYCRLNKLALTTLRPSQIYGDSDHSAQHQPFFHQMVDKAWQGQDITIYGKHDARRNYIHSDDLAQLIDRIIMKRIEGTYPCMYPADVTYSHIAHAAQKIFGKGGSVTFLKDKPDTPDNIFRQDNSLYEKLAYYPQISIEAGLQKIKKYRERRAV